MSAVEDAPVEELVDLEHQITCLLQNAGCDVQRWINTFGLLRDTCIFTKNGKVYHMFLELRDVSGILDDVRNFASYGFGMHELETAKIVVPTTKFLKFDEARILNVIQQARL